MGTGTVNIMPGQQVSAWDLPAELLEKVLWKLSNRDRCGLLRSTGLGFALSPCFGPDVRPPCLVSRALICRACCELVCRQWHAVSRGSKTLWATVEWKACKSSVGELRWLSSRGPVKQAALHLDPEFGPVNPAMVTAFCCGAWASSLRALEVVEYEGEASGCNFLASLQHLTLLSLDVDTEGPADQFAGLSTLVQLRSLAWYVALQAGSTPEPELPLPPNLEHLQVSLSHWRLGRLSMLARLQSLHLDRVPYSSFEAALGALEGLTCLVLEECDLAEVPAGLSALTALRLFVLACDDPGATPEGRASLLRLAHLPSLEFLRLSMSGTLPPLGRLSSPPPLRCLDISGHVFGSNLLAPFPDASWLGSLQALRCFWSQVSGGAAGVHPHCLGFS